MPITLESAYQLTRALLGDEPQSRLLIGFHGLFARRLGVDAVHSVAALEAGLMVVQNFPPFRLELIRCLRELDEVSVALEAVEALLEELPKWGEARQEQILLELDQGATERAEGLFKRYAETLHPKLRARCEAALEQATTEAFH